MPGTTQGRAWRGEADASQLEKALAKTQMPGGHAGHRQSRL